MQLDMLGIKHYYIFSCLDVRLKCSGNIHSKTELILLVLFEINCKTNNLGFAKIPFLYINDVMKHYYK